MKKRLRVCGFTALILVAVSLIIKYGYADLSAFAWHLRHGFHAELLGVRVPVPLSYEAEDPAGLPYLSLIKLPGILWHGADFIEIDFRGLPSQDAQAATVAIVTKSGSTLKRTKTAERPAAFAGRQGACSEYDIELVDPRLVFKSFEIYCHFDGNVSATFMGSPKREDDFYNIIRGAKPLGAKK